MARACGSYPQCQGFKSLLRYYTGVSPSGKATDSDSVIRRFESCYPSFESLKRLSFFMRLSQYEKNPRQYVVDRRIKSDYIGKTKIKTQFGLRQAKRLKKHKGH